jgi:hypothetical protein
VSSLASTVEIGLNCVDDKCENGASQWRENWRILRRNRRVAADVDRLIHTKHKFLLGLA